MADQFPRSCSRRSSLADQSSKTNIWTQAFTTVYTALVYGVFYSFFESFPLVYIGMYNFNLGQASLPFLAVLVALLACMPAYFAYYYYIVEKRVKKIGFGPPEERLIPGLVATFFIPIGLFIFG